MKTNCPIDSLNNFTGRRFEIVNIHEITSTKNAFNTKLQLLRHVILYMSIFFQWKQVVWTVNGLCSVGRLDEQTIANVLNLVHTYLSIWSGHWPRQHPLLFVNRGPTKALWIVRHKYLVAGGKCCQSSRQ